MSSGKLPITHVARLARLELTAGEAELFDRQLGPILGMIDKLQALDLTDEESNPIPPVGHVPVRIDEPIPGLEKEAALLNAPAKARDQFMVPRVIDAE